MAAPHRFFCPITHAIMHEPMRDPHGHRFEKCAIQAWLSLRSCCPMGREPMYANELFLDQLLLDEINEWRKQCAAAGISLEEEELSAAEFNDDAFVVRPQSLTFRPQQVDIPRATTQLVWTAGLATTFTCCDVSPNREWLVVGSSHQLKVWQLRTREEHTTLKPTFGNKRFGAVVRCAISPCSQGIAAIYADNVVRVWDISKASCRLMLKGLEPRPTACSLDTGCAMLAWGNAEGFLQVWDVTSRKAIEVHRRHTDRIHCIAFSPCGLRLASASSDRLVRISNMNSQAAPVVCRGHFGATFSCVFDRTGAFLLSASEDGMVKLWDSFMGAVLHSYNGHHGAVHGASFSADGLRVLASSSNGRLKVWDRDTANALAIVYPPCERTSCFAIADDWIVMCTHGGRFQLWQWRILQAASGSTVEPAGSAA